MAEMEKRFPGSREQSVFASVELSLRRMSPANRDRARVLGVFHGGVELDVLRVMMQWEEADVAALAGELVATGLATPNRYNHLTLNPALCPYLRGRMDAAEREALTARWVEAMRAYAEFLEQQQSQNAEVAATLTVLELPNLFALLDLVQRAGDAEATIGLATSLYSLLQNAGKPRLLERVGQVRDAAAAALGDAWNHARFEAARTRIEQQLAGGRLREAFEGAQAVAPARPGGGRAGVSRRRLRSGDGLLPPGPRVEDGRRLGTGLAAAGRGPPALRGRREGASRQGAERMASICFAEQRRLSSPTWAGSTKRRRPTKRASAAPSNSVTPGRSPSAKASLGPSAWSSAATRRRWRRMPKRASGSRSWTNRASVAVSLASDRHGVSEGGPAGSGGGCLPEIARDQGAARKCRRAGGHAHATGELV